MPLWSVMQVVEIAMGSVEPSMGFLTDYTTCHKELWWMAIELLFHNKQVVYVVGWFFGPCVIEKNWMLQLIVLCP